MSYKTIDEYIGLCKPDVQLMLQEIRAIVRKSAPGAEETISYGIPTFKLKENLVHFAAFKNHIGFYPTSSAIVYFKKELAPYKHARGSVQFPIDKPIPYKLIESMVKYRVFEVNKKFTKEK